MAGDGVPPEVPKVTVNDKVDPKQGNTDAKLDPTTFQVGRLPTSGTDNTAQYVNGELKLDNPGQVTRVAAQVGDGLNGAATGIGLQAPYRSLTQDQLHDHVRSTTESVIARINAAPTAKDAQAVLAAHLGLLSSHGQILDVAAARIGQLRELT